MIRWLARGGVVVLGFLAGAGVVLALQQSPSTTPWPTATPSPSPRADAVTKPAPAPEPDDRLLLAWTPGGLPTGFADAVGDLPDVGQVTVVHGGLVELTGSYDADGTPVDALDDGWAIPLDAVVVDPDSYPRFVPKSAAVTIAELGPDEALLSETGARLRGLGEGDRLALRDVPDATVTAVVDDTVIGGAEVAVHIDAAATAPALRPRYLLLTATGDRGELEQAVRGALPDGPAVRLRGPGEAPFLRHGDAVLTQAQVKERFGEFSYQRLPGRDIQQHPDWTAANIETAVVPVLGRVTCHRAVLPALHGALAELEREHLAHTVDVDGFAGCHAPRLTTSRDSVSRHAWGVAFDLNSDDNPSGQSSAQDPRLVEVLERWGFTGGGSWLVPDPAHFEYVRPPAPGTGGP